MPATVTTANVEAGYNQTILMNALVAQFSSVWGTPVYQGVGSGTELRAVWSVPPLQAGDKATFFVLEVTTSFTVSCRMAQGFVSPNTFANIVTQSSATFSASSSSIALTLVRVTNELVLLLMVQGSGTRGMFGLISPAELSTWWLRSNAGPWLLISTSSLTSSVTYFNNPQPFTPTGNVQPLTANITLRSVGGVSSENPALLKREVFSPVIFASSAAFFGVSGLEMGHCAASGLAQFDTLVVQSGVEEWLFLDSNAQIGFVVRTV